MFLIVMKVSSRYFVDNQCFPELRRLYVLIDAAHILKVPVVCHFGHFVICIFTSIC